MDELSTRETVDTLSANRRRVSRRSILKMAAGAVGALTVAPLLQACTTTPPPTQAPSGAPAGSPAAAPTKAPAAAARKEVTVVTGLDPGALDPHGVNAAVSEATVVYGQVFETLIDITYDAEGKPSLVPMLATSWKQVNDTTLELKLRDGVKFHNGEAFTSEAVKFSIERIMDPAMKSPATQYLPPVLDKIETPDPLTVRLVNKSPYPLTILRLTRVRIVPPKYTQEKGTVEFAKAPMGTGPFKYVEWIKDDHTYLDKNSAYWNGEPKADRLIFKPMPEAGSRTAALKSGAADIITLVPIADVKSIEDSTDLKIGKVPSLRCMFVQMDNIADTPLKNVKVRQALNYAVDKDALVTHILNGNGVKLEGQQSSKQYFGYNPDLKAFPYDPDKAKALLAEAGYPNGFDIELKGPVGRYMMDKELTEAIAGQLQKVGVRAKPNIMEWSVYIPQLYQRPGLGPMFFLGWSPLPDFLDMVYMQTTPSVTKYHDSPEFDKMWTEASMVMDEAKRGEMYKKMSVWLHDNPPAIYLHQQMNIYGMKKSVSGFTPTPDEFMRLKDLTKG